MLRATVFILLCFGFSFSQPKVDNRVDTLVKRIDSLSWELKKSQTEAGISKEFFIKGSDQTNQKLNIFLIGGLTLVVGVFAFIAIIGIINYSISKNEASHIRKTIEDRVLASFETERKAMEGLYSQTAKSLETMEESVKLRNERALKAIEDGIEGIEKRHSEIVGQHFDVSRLEAVGDTMAMLNKFGPAAGCYAEVGIIRFEGKKAGYEEEISKIAVKIIPWVKQAFTQGGYLYGQRDNVAKFSVHLGAINQSQQKQLQEALNHGR